MQDWAGAVALLLDACNQITGQEYSGVSHSMLQRPALCLDPISQNQVHCLCHSSSQKPHTSFGMEIIFLTYNHLLDLLMQIGALEGIKSELRLRRNMLLKALTAELERLMYDDLEAHADLGTLGTLDSNFCRALNRLVVLLSCFHASHLHSLP